MGSTLYSKRQYKGKKHPESLRRERHRPKTFKTEEKAVKYAEEKGWKDFEIVQLSATKFRVDKIVLK